MLLGFVIATSELGARVGNRFVFRAVAVSLEANCCSLKGWAIYGVL